MRAITAIISVSLMAGCAATGVRVTDEQVASLQIGEATESDAIKAFGPATSRTRMADGSVWLVYSYAEVKARPASFIPIIGPLVGGSDSRVNMVMLTFGPDGKLKSTQANEQAFGTGTGAAAGTMQPALEQPRK